MKVGVDFTPKIGGRWTAGYHERLYSLTDDAIRGEMRHSAPSTLPRALLSFELTLKPQPSANAGCFCAACPANTEWVIVTNGDNEYASTLFSRLEQARDADIVAFDFYSRYQRVTGEMSSNVYHCAQQRACLCAGHALIQCPIGGFRLPQALRANDLQATQKRLRAR